MVDGVANTQLGGLPPMTTRDAKPAGAAQHATGAARPSTGVRVELEATQAGAPPLDLARVARIKADIAAGGYRPDPARIAEAMVRDL